MWRKGTWCSNLPGLDKDFLAQDLWIAIQGQVGVKWEGSSHAVNLSTLTACKNLLLRSTCSLNFKALECSCPVTALIPTAGLLKSMRFKNLFGGSLLTGQSLLYFVYFSEFFLQWIPGEKASKVSWYLEKFLYHQNYEMKTLFNCNLLVSKVAIRQRIFQFFRTHICMQIVYMLFANNICVVYH